MFLAVFFKIIVTKDRSETVPDPKGGVQKGHIPPPPPKSDTKAYLAPRKKLIIHLITAKVVPVRVAHSNLIPTRIQSVKMVGH